MPTTMIGAVLSDEVLIERALTGSKESFESLYERHFPRVYSFVARRVRDTPEAEDVVQDIFIQAMMNLAAYRAQGSFLRWLYGITRNVLKRHYLKQARASEELGSRRVNVNESPDTLHDQVTPERRTAAREMGAQVLQALASLDADSREIYVLHHLEGVSIRDLSLRTLRSEDAIKSDLYRIRRRLVEGD